MFRNRTILVTVVTITLAGLAVLWWWARAGTATLPAAAAPREASADVPFGVQRQDAADFVRARLEDLPAGSFPTFVRAPQRAALTPVVADAAASYTSGSFETMWQSLASRHAPMPEGYTREGMETMQRAHAPVLATLSIDAARPVKVVPYIVAGVTRDLQVEFVNSSVQARTSGMPCHDDPPSSQHAVAVTLPIWYRSLEGKEVSAELSLLLQWNVAQSRWEQVGLRIDGEPTNATVLALPG